MTGVKDDEIEIVEFAKVEENEEHFDLTTWSNNTDGDENVVRRQWRKKTFIKPQEEEQQYETETQEDLENPNS